MASKRHIRRKSCIGKRQYGTIQDAQKAAAIASRRDGWMIAYYCQFGGHCHIGHPQKKMRHSLKMAGVL